MNDFSEWLARKIKESELSISEFARRAGLSPSGVTNILNRKRKQPDFYTLKKIATYLNFDMAELLKLNGVSLPKVEESWSTIQNPELRAWLTAENMNSLPDPIQKAIIALIKIGLEVDQVAPN